MSSQGEKRFRYSFFGIFILLLIAVFMIRPFDRYETSFAIIEILIIVWLYSFALGQNIFWKFYSFEIYYLVLMSPFILGMLDGQREVGPYGIYEEIAGIGFLVAFLSLFVIVPEYYSNKVLEISKKKRISSQDRIKLLFSFIILLFPGVLIITFLIPTIVSQLDKPFILILLLIGLLVAAVLPPYFRTSNLKRILFLFFSILFFFWLYPIIIFLLVSPTSIIWISFYGAFFLIIFFFSALIRILKIDRNWLIAFWPSKQNS